MSGKKITKKLLFTLLILTLFPTCLFANKVVTFAIGEWTPYTSEKDPACKIAETIVTEALKLENINVVYEYYPWKRSYIYAKKGYATGTFPWTKTKERTKEFIYSKESLVMNKSVFFHLKIFNFSWNNYEDLKKYTIGTVLGYRETGLLKSKKLTVYPAMSDEQNFKLLLLKRINIVVCDKIVGYSTINRLFPPDKATLFTNNPKPIIEEEMFLLISKNIPDGQKIADAFDRGIRKLKKSGRYDKIIGDLQ